MTPGSTSSTEGPRVLAVDTTSPLASIALVVGARVVAETSLRGPLGHAEALVPALMHLLGEARLPLEAVDAFAAATGPGSFTGVRVGLATLQGLVLATGRPAFGVPSLFTHALLVPHCVLPVRPLIDPRRGQVYTALYDTRGGAPVPIEVGALRDIEQVLSSVSAPTLFVGDGAFLLADRLRETAGPHFVLASGAIGEGLAAAVGLHVAAALAEGQAARLGPLEPCYLQASAPEENERRPI